MPQPQNKFMRMRGPRSRDDFSARGFGFAVSDIFGNRAVKQERLLQHQPDMTPVICHCQTPDIDTVH